MPDETEQDGSPQSTRPPGYQPEGPPTETEPSRLRERIGLLLGPLLLTILLLLPAPEGMSEQGWKTTAVGALMATWWISEAIPIAATALIPLVLFPLLGILPIGDTAPAYANPLIFLFLGGFVIALAMERWNLHRRIALAVVRVMGVKPKRLVLGFMVATAFLSMWVSNTATAVMMVPIALSVVHLVRPGAEYGEGQPLDFNFAISLMLGVAYAASIGGLATLIGTPPNALLAGFMLETYGIEIGFAQWMVVGVPLTVVALPLSWLVLTSFVYPIRIREIPGGRETIDREYRALGPISTAEKAVAAVFVATAALWVTRPLLEETIPGIHDTVIAIAAALVLFLIPVGGGEHAMNWETAEKLPWGVLLLFGGGLALADAVKESGLAEWIGGSVGGLGWSVFAMILAVTTIIVFLTELTSNTATAAAFLPLVASIAVGLGEDPFLLAVPAALAASCAFMMPVATPPNAIVFGSGYVTVPQMARAGLWLNVLFIALITALVYGLIPLVFGVETGVVPAWAQEAAAG
jgi:sodium-dependent dicarboxylate transporter 2/3/5